MSNDARLFAPAAARNVTHIVDAIREIAPNAREGLEIAAGSGEHAVAIAAAMPALTWRPTDVDPAKLTSIEAWRVHAGAPNIAPAQPFDAAAHRWTGPRTDIAFAANILHLIPMDAAKAVVAAMADALAPGGVLAIYGPFLREDGFASEGDRAFDARLKVENPGGGYKLVTEVEGWMEAEGLTLRARRDMPANNLILSAAR